MLFNFIRSTIFNLLFFVVTSISCVLLLPTLFLPRQAYLFTVRFFVYTTEFLARTILGQRFEVRGREHLPTSGAYIVAAKHQSAYETLKLHILFKDPAVVLKKELLSIPVWGKYLEKSGVIAIDRSSPKAAIKSIQDGAIKIAAQGRPMIIFPQGTRVRTDQTIKDKPYKIGVTRMQEAANVPIIPLALNTGLYWPRGSWTQKPGTIIFEFLPAIPPGGNPSETLRKLESQLEEKSGALLEEGRNNMKKAKKSIAFAIILPILLITAWCINWKVMESQARKVTTGYLKALSEHPGASLTGDLTPRISGFPGKMKIEIGPHTLATNQGFVSIVKLEATGWPVPSMPVDLTSGPITLNVPGWKDNITFDALEARLRYHGNDILTTESSRLTRGDFEGTMTGDLDFAQKPYPGIDLLIKLKNHEILIGDLVARNVLKKNPAMLANMALTAMKRDKVVEVPLKREQDNLYLGPILIAQFPAQSRADLLQARTKPALTENKVE
ncbi:MAG: 1-acyl-sn-glycerol-3-phosphate acyltransferase [Alphaproteobacteria bacterium]|nr:1-acyl-sn-glycerol-3-phosphate acyltransferase [Alphaproteobacteria bacterium]